MPSVTLGTSFLGPAQESFKTTDFLGKGGFGEVYLAVGETSGAVVAVKLLPLGSLSSDDSRLALMNEVLAAQQIKHPNVVEVLFVNDGNNSPVGPYVVMEYVSGGTLAQLIKKHLQAKSNLSLDRAVEIMVDVAQGAKAINAKVIHRDIKPDNILAEGKIFKIGDFGISKFVDESTRLHTFKGAQHVMYMAPEGWQYLPNTPKLDVYSTGLVFYEILTNVHPLWQKVKDHNNFLDWEKAHMYEPCPDVRKIRAEVPLPLAQLLSRMVSKRPDDRPLWDEVLNILTKPDVSGAPQNPLVSEAVEAAVSKKQQLDSEALKQAEKLRERQTQLNLYRYSCTSLLDSFDPLIEQFNKAFQHGQVTREDSSPTTTYRVPLGDNIQVTFYQPNWHQGEGWRNYRRWLDWSVEGKERQLSTSEA